MRQLGFVDLTGEALSPMATAMARAMLGEGWRVDAWAVEPAADVDPRARESLAEWGLELDVLPRRFAPADIPRPSVLIVLGPLPTPTPMPGVAWVHWPLSSQGSGGGARRSQRDRIRHRLEAWAAEFG